MGRWSQTEYDRVLASKIKQIFHASEDITNTGRDIEFDPRGYRSFIRALDPKDKGVQACLRTLVQRVSALNRNRETRAERVERPPCVWDYLSTLDRRLYDRALSQGHDPASVIPASRLSSAERIVREQRARLEPSNEVLGSHSSSSSHVNDNETDGPTYANYIRSRSPPPRLRTRTIRHAPPSDLRPVIVTSPRMNHTSSAPVPISQTANNPSGSESVPRPMRRSITVALSDADPNINDHLLAHIRSTNFSAGTGPRSASGSRSSRQPSPSRIRRNGLNPSAPSFEPGQIPRTQTQPRIRSASPPTAASQAWLNEFSAFNAFVGDDDLSSDTGAGAGAGGEGNAWMTVTDFTMGQEETEALLAARGGIAQQRRRRVREDDDDDDDEEGEGRRMRQRRRFSRPPRAGSGLNVDLEREELFGWSGGTGSGGLAGVRGIEGLEGDDADEVEMPLPLYDMLAAGAGAGGIEENGDEEEEEEDGEAEFGLFQPISFGPIPDEYDYHHGDD